MAKRTRTIAPQVATTNLLDAANDKGSLGDVFMTSGSVPSIDSMSYNYREVGQPSIDSISYNYLELSKHGIGEIFFSYDDGDKYNLIGFT